MLFIISNAIESTTSGSILIVYYLHFIHPSYYLYMQVVQKLQTLSLQLQPSGKLKKAYTYAAHYLYTQ